MNYWLICLPREDLEHCMRKGTFGIVRKQVICQVQKGDAVVCCAGKGDWKVVGIGRAEGDYYIDDAQIFLKEGYYPDRFDFSVDKLPKEQEVDIIGILDKLSFVKNVAYWAVFFRRGIAKLSKQDFDLITRLAKNPVSGKR